MNPEGRRPLDLFHNTTLSAVRPGIFARDREYASVYHLRLITSICQADFFILTSALHQGYNNFRSSSHLRAAA
jgi:hypothetical protein